ncbi:MAG TPA: flagellar type III secretion system pore protein FliP [Alphaproteobacteria bacterium]|nr:flagellar type III secretion system pore protein FliP [Alphaproteobacteria bacterium]
MKRYGLFFLTAFLFSYGICQAESLTLDLGSGSGSFSARLIQMLILFTVLSLAPSIVIMVTSFTRFIVVFSFLRSALGLQQSPPNVVLVSLAIFMTGFVMSPVFETAYTQGIKPLMEEKIDEMQAFDKVSGPLKTFMLKNVREKDLELFATLSKQNTQQSSPAQELSLFVVVPAFIISELRRSFEIGFVLFLPFLIIDMVVASILMAMGMMMLPPVMIALPFKLIFFVLVDGWNLVTESLLKSYN